MRTSLTPSPTGKLLLLTCLLLGLNIPKGQAGDTEPAGPAAIATSAAGPKTPAAKTVTNFSQALRCMDEVFLAHGTNGIVITSSGVPDETGKVRTGTKEMLITAIAAMTLKSHAFEFIDFHGGGDDLARLFEARGNQSRKIPDYYIRGSITQMDDNVVRSAKGAGVSSSSESGGESLDPISLAMGASKDESFDLVSMDMSIGVSATRRILAASATTNTMMMTKSGKSGDTGGKLGKVGLSFNLDRNHSEGLGAATRALLELNLIETLGKFTQVPYWHCLDADTTNPLIREQARENYDVLQDKDRILFVQRKLAGSMNRYRGPLDGAVNTDLKQAVAEYQAGAGLIANGQINFDVYASLLDTAQHSLAALPATKPQTPLQPAATDEAPSLALGADVVSARSNTRPIEAFRIKLEDATVGLPNYRVGEFFKMTLSLSSDGTVYCYYEDSAHNTSRIFPNQFQSSPMLKARSRMPLPTRGFKIRFDYAGREKIACIGTDGELLIPQALIGAKDLTPLPVKSIDEVVSLFLQSNPTASVNQIDATVNR